MKVSQHRARLIGIFIFFALILSVLLWRMYSLTVLDRKFLQGQGNARSNRTVDIPAHRGMVMDRNGIPLAVSTPMLSLWINPKLYQPSNKQLRALAKLLHSSAARLILNANPESKREFVYLKRQISPNLAQKIKALKIPGLNFQEEFKRFYPQAESTAQLIGFNNVDDNGIEGLELAYQNWLRGISGKRKVIRDRNGQIIEEQELIRQPRPGQNLRLSIDNRIQYFAFHELQDTLSQFAAKAGSIIVLDAKNGEVLAIANAPSFNPNARAGYSRASYRNTAITDAFEPGSVIKPLSIASAFESGQFSPTTVIDTRPSQMVVHGRLIRDIHNYGVLDVTGVLQRSSNVGVTKMVLASPPEQLYNLLLKSGFSQRTESTYPGESDGTMVRLKDVNPFVQATMSFGYGLTVTALQLAKSYLLFANHGQLLPVTLLHYNKPIQKTEVISAKTADQVLAMMEAVVEQDGTGKLARVPGYRVAGKTGTARIAGKKGYDEKRYISSFIGVAPVSNPRLIVAVVIFEPSKQGYYGGAVAAPLFSKVMAAALRILDVPPDQVALPATEGAAHAA